MAIGQNAVGAAWAVAETNPTFALGTIMWDAGKAYIYLRANGAVTGDGYVVSFAQDFDAAMIDTDAAATITQGINIAVAEVDVADNEYFWGQIYGPCGIRTEQDALADSKLAATADAGQVDDASATAGTKYIDGMILNTATGGADAVNSTGYLVFPKIMLVGTYA